MQPHVVSSTQLSAHYNQTLHGLPAELGLSRWHSKQRSVIVIIVRRCSVDGGPFPTKTAFRAGLRVLVRGLDSVPRRPLTPRSSQG